MERTAREIKKERRTLRDGTEAQAGGEHRARAASHAVSLRTAGAPDSGPGLPGDIPGGAVAGEEGDRHARGARRAPAFIRRVLLRGAVQVRRVGGGETVSPSVCLSARSHFVHISFTSRSHLVHISFTSRSFEGLYKWMDECTLLKVVVVVVGN